MPNELLPIPIQREKFVHSDTLESAHELEKTISDQLRMAGKQPFNKELLFSRRALEIAKQEERIRLGIKGEFCVRSINIDKSQRFKISFFTEFRTGQRVETLVVSSSPKEPVIKYIYYYKNKGNKNYIEVNAENNATAIRRTRRMLKLPLL